MGEQTKVAYRRANGTCGIIDPLSDKRRWRPPCGRHTGWGQLVLPWRLLGGGASCLSLPHRSRALPVVLGATRSADVYAHICTASVTLKCLSRQTSAPPGTGRTGYRYRSGAECLGVQLISCAAETSRRFRRIRGRLSSTCPANMSPCI